MKFRVCMHKRLLRIHCMRSERPTLRRLLYRMILYCLDKATYTCTCAIGLPICLGPICIQKLRIEAGHFLNN